MELPTRRTTLRHVALILVLAGVAGACGATTDPDAPPPAAPTTNAPPTPAQAGPAARDLAGVDRADAELIAGYLGWTELTVPPIDALTSLGSAHGGTKRIWASPQRNALVDGTGRQRFPYPNGTVIVKQGSRDGAPVLIALMEKTGAAGATGGWRYVEYTRSTPDSPYAKVGLPEAGCAGCHANASTRQQTDWVFWSLR